MYDTEEELGSVLAFQVLVGQRRHGHFDHDAHGMTGTSNATGAKRLTKSRDHAVGSVYDCVKIKRDPRTGALLRK